jgi:hypothetical protein
MKNERLTDAELREIISEVTQKSYAAMASELKIISSHPKMTPELLADVSLSVVSTLMSTLLVALQINCNGSLNMEHALRDVFEKMKFNLLYRN